MLDTAHRPGAWPAASVALVLFAFVPNTHAVEGDAKSGLQDIEEMLVVGEHPGPGVWTVRKDDHALYVLGVQQPLPKKLVWRSREVEALIAQSQELITAGGTSLDVDLGFFGFFSATTAFIRARKIPNGGTLNQTLQPRVYSKWLDLRLKYMGRSDRYDRLRPVWAAQELQRFALKESGFSKDDAIAATVSKVARKHRVKITSPVVEVELKLDDPGALFDRLGQLDIDDGGCFERTLDELEDRLDRRRERANAWAVGDVGNLYDLCSRVENRECMRETMQAMMAAGSAGTTFGPAELMNWIKEEAPRARAEARRRWISAAEDALATNHRTFALLPMFDVVNPAGWLQDLRDKGYNVEAPRDAGLDRKESPQFDVERPGSP